MMVFLASVTLDRVIQGHNTSSTKKRFFRKLFVLGVRINVCFGRGRRYSDFDSSQTSVHLAKTKFLVNPSRWAGLFRIKSSRKRLFWDEVGGGDIMHAKFPKLILKLLHQTTKICSDVGSLTPLAALPKLHNIRSNVLQTNIHISTRCK